MSNVRTTRVEPTELDEVISSTSAMAPRWRSRGVATLVAMVSGLAPAIVADTKIAGMFTSGIGETGRRKNATNPASANPIVTRVVAMGRVMKGSEMFMARQCPQWARRAYAAKAGRNRDR